MSRKLAGIALVVSLSGCAALAVTDDVLGQRTSLALGLDRADFTISNRVDSGTRTDYTATTKAGKIFNCYMTGSLSTIGRVTSDAMCTEKGKPAGNPLLRGG